MFRRKPQFPDFVAPTTAIDLKRFLVPLDGSQASLDALALACLLAKRNRGAVYAAHVIQVRRSLPIDADLGPDLAEGRRILEQAEEVARALDVQVSVEQLQGREAGHVIADEAGARGVDAIILGVEYQRPLGEFSMGETAEYLLKHAPCQVWALRRPPRD